MPRDLRPLLDTLADDLDAARDDLEALGQVLCADESVAARFIGVLQAIDAIGQRQGVAAAVLRSPDPYAAAAAVTLESVRGRFRSLFLTCPYLPSGDLA